MSTALSGHSHSTKNITSVMPKKQPVIEKSLSPRILPGQREQTTLLVLVGTALVMMVGYWGYLGGHRGELIEVEQSPQLRASFLVDINQAELPEFIQLPGLGETLAQRIVLERQQNGVFHGVDDLVRVNGIGIKKLEKIRPYLLPLVERKKNVASLVPANNPSDEQIPSN